MTNIYRKMFIGKVLGKHRKGKLSNIFGYSSPALNSIFNYTGQQQILNEDSDEPILKYF